MQQIAQKPIEFNIRLIHLPGFLLLLNQLQIFSKLIKWSIIKIHISIPFKSKPGPQQHPPAFSPTTFALAFAARPAMIFKTGPRYNCWGKWQSWCQPPKAEPSLFSPRRSQPASQCSAMSWYFGWSWMALHPLHLKFPGLSWVQFTAGATQHHESAASSRLISD